MKLKTKKSAGKSLSRCLVTAEKVVGKFDVPCNPAQAQAELADSHAAEFPLSRLKQSNPEGWR